LLGYKRLSGAKLLGKDIEMLVADIILCI
jgi:hypothetical protein